MRIGELADATPARRDRYVDFLRASAIVTVVVGHWLAVMAERPRRRKNPSADGSTARTAVALVLAGTAAACVGIFRLTVGGFQGTGPAGVPLTGLITYGAGLLAFWAARHVGAPRPGAGGGGGEGEGAGRHG